MGPTAWIRTMPPRWVSAAAIIGSLLVGYAAAFTLVDAAEPFMRPGGAAVVVGVVLGGFTLLLGPLALGVSALPHLGAAFRIGADGVAFRWLGTERFVPYHRVQALVRVPMRGEREARKNAYLLLADGSREQITGGASDDLAAHFDEIERRILEAARSTRAACPEAIAELPDRTAWLARVQAAAQKGDEYRDAPLDREALLAVVEDAGARPALRAAAATVLARCLQPDERARVRLAAAATAAPRVRVVLDAAGADDARTEDVERALARAVTE